MRQREEGVRDWQRGRTLLAVIAHLEDTDERTFGSATTRSSYTGRELLQALEIVARHSPVDTEGLRLMIREMRQHVLRLDQLIPLAHVGSFLRDVFRRADAVDAILSAEAR